MANRHRGEVDLTLAGRHHTLRLTLGALAEIEDALALDGIAALGARFAAGTLKARDLVALLGAALRGGGADLTDAAVAAMVGAGDLPAVAEALGLLFARAFGEAETSGAGPVRPRPARR